MTSVGLMALTSKRPGSTSFQVLSKGRTGQIYADATEAGHLRGMIRNRSLAYPPLAGAAGRIEIAPLVMPGDISVIRQDARGDYAQSAVHLVSGELDLDVAAFALQSDQIPTVVAAEVLLDGEGKVTLAGGVFAQLHPDGDREELEALRRRIAGGALVELLRAAKDSGALLEAVSPGAVIVEAPALLQWQCRCTYERVRSSLRLFTPADLAEIIEKDEPVVVDCDLCSRQYSVPVAEVVRAFQELVKAEG